MDMASLIALVKRHLGMEWCDESTTLILGEQIEEAMFFLRRYDPYSDFEEDAWVRGLMIEYVRYTRAGASDDFRKNYRNDLISLSDRGRVRHAQKQKT